MITRHFTKNAQTIDDVLNDVKWITSDVIIPDYDPNKPPVFEQKDCEFPDFWGEQSCRIVASKYFWGKIGEPNREYSLKQLISRVVDKITLEGLERGYFDRQFKYKSPTDDKYYSSLGDKDSYIINQPNSEYNIFRAELAYLILHQRFAFNSPVWFNVGTQNKQQISACFITDVEDNLESILEHAKVEGLIFRGGSGNGVNLSKLREEGGRIGNSGGQSSGPISWDIIYDAVAKTTKSGGVSRRAARLVCLDDNHPDIFKFIGIKAHEEEKAKVLGQAGYDASPGGEAYMTVAHQNGNYSVQVSDAFMKALEADEDWNLISRKDESIVKTVRAKDLWDAICESAWKSGDPGLQFSDTINEWNTSINDARIISSNPCLHGDTLIELENVGYIKIKDAVGRIERILGPDLKYHKHGGIVKTATKKTYEIVFLSDRNLKLTDNHKIYASISSDEFDPYKSKIFPKFDYQDKSTLKEGMYVIRKSMYNSMVLDRILYILDNDEKEYDVFDVIEVGDTNSFLANDITVHNCSEFLHLTNTSCNLASINLVPYYMDGAFDVNGYLYTIMIATIAQNILIDFGEFPTESIKQGTLEYRPIGLGFSNLGALLMLYSTSYDSDIGRSIASMLSAAITSQAYFTSRDLAFKLNRSYPAFQRNKNQVDQVLRNHLLDFKAINNKYFLNFGQLLNETITQFESLITDKNLVLLNSYVSNHAPVGTIGIMMGCDSLGIEPDIALVKAKTLVGGGVLKFVSSVFKQSLKNLGYTENEIEQIYNTLIEKNELDILDRHKNIFACALDGIKNCPVLTPEAHIKMLAAVQSFISGGISKTVNCPSTTTVEDISDLYKMAYKLGVKCVAVYRDGSKMSQPMSAKKTETAPEVTQPQITEEKCRCNNKPKRNKLPNDRNSKTHKFSIGGHEGYITVGFYADGTPGEVFITMNKAGSFVNGIMDSLATSISIGLQYGVPLNAYIDKFKYQKFDPAGFTIDEKVRNTTSVVDYLAKYLENRFLSKENTEINTNNFAIASTTKEEENLQKAEQISYIPCNNCGSPKVLVGKCFTCLLCGEGGECGG